MKTSWIQALLAIGATAFAASLALAGLCLAAGAVRLALLVGLPALLGTALLATLRLPRAGRLRVGVASVLLGSIWAWSQVAPAATPPAAGPPIEARWLDGVPRGAWFPGVPEHELVALGATFGLTARESVSVDGLRGERRRLEHDDSAAGWRASMVLDGWLRDRGHYWLVRPAGDGRFPLLLFVHGSGGNFRCFARTLGRAAHAHGVAAAFPTLGFGHWPPQRVAERLREVAAQVAQEVPIDAARTTIVGLSAGVPGALVAAAHWPSPGVRVVAVSGDYAGAGVASRIHDLLVLHGEQDERTPAAAARVFADAVAAAGGRVARHFVPDGDHLLLLARADTFLPVLLAFAARH